MAPLPATTAAGAAAPVPAPASQPPPSSMPPPQQQHQQPPPPPFAQQQAAPAPSPGAPMPGGMRLSFDHMAGKTEHHHHAAPMLYAPPPPPQSTAGAGAPGGNVLGMGELMRKKRGRPRKYAPDGSMALALAPISSASAGGAAAPGQQQHGGFSISSPPSDPNAKRRGRPPGSGKKKQFEALVRVLLPCSVSYIAFTPHILTESPSRHDSDNQLHDAVGKDEQYLVFVPSPHLPQHARQDLLLKFSFLFLLGEQKFDTMDSGRI